MLTRKRLATVPELRERTLSGTWHEVTVIFIIRKTRTLLQLDSGDRRLMLQALGRVGLVRLGLWVLPFPSVQRLVERTGSLRSHRDSSLNLDRAAWAVVGASRSVPRATCLTQAIAGRWLLATYGYPSHVHVGTARNAEGRLELHAWLDCDGKIVIGGEEYAAFQALPDVFKR